ncbi:hypothetical protein [uncultured Lactobacillus sp.]|uniref:hypothetical protein n=1 Tax=uncultured Lactobacillus sp. TaxID=153152 RepID=UPI0025F0868D|nr:hypothetical protein [uncultured Lactobacillus sp.]
MKKKVWSYSLPMISKLFVQQLYSVIDMAIIGRYLGARIICVLGSTIFVIKEMKHLEATEKAG